MISTNRTESNNLFNYHLAVNIRDKADDNAILLACDQRKNIWLETESLPSFNYIIKETGVYYRDVWQKDPVLLSEINKDLYSEILLNLLYSVENGYALIEQLFASKRISLQQEHQATLEQPF